MKREFLTSGGTGSHITALLGPTNTGKTHRAIERMVELGGGLIGLPLRLLAREVYDRVVAKVGVEKVALITGEERIEPRMARYWVCTVESMPTTRAVPFVAVDEIQLAAHPERGHVFTDRLLNARGTRETWFLGSDTMRPLIERLTPTAKVVTYKRLSSLHYEDPRKLSNLPHRSAVVAFSVAHVYELAERLRASHGGVAVVLGALSPKARNAQVALFESGEVNHMVSTDAIGMGLNLNIRHIYFAALQKYDGREIRLLEPWEMGQIAGRAGRHKKDGHFGLTYECASRQRTPGWLIDSVERQRFEPVRRIYYRNSDLDLSSVDALTESLSKTPFSRALLHARGMGDERALQMLLRTPDIASSVRRDARRVEVLWDVCRVPDYRQDSETAHVRLLAQLYRQLIGKHERLDADWVDRRLRKLAHYGGSIDAMMQRIAYTRTWAFIAHRADWLSNTDHWRSRVLEVEEKISAALHEQLTQHFVDERAHVKVERSVPHGVALEGDRVVTRTIALGRMISFSFASNPEADRIFGHKEVRRSARRVCLEPAEQVARIFLDEPDDALHWGENLQPTWLDQPLTRLTQGARLDTPKLRVLPMDLLPEEVRRQLQRRIEAWLKAELGDFQALLDVPEATGPLGGLLYLLRSHLGVIKRWEARDQIRALTTEDKRALSSVGVRLGVRYVYARPMLKQAFQPLRAACLAVWHSLDQVPELPGHAQAPAASWRDDFAEALGYPRLGPLCVRVDLYEKITALMRKRIKKGPVPLPSEPMQWLGCQKAEWESVAAALGYRVTEEGVFPPPRRRR